MVNYISELIRKSVSALKDKIPGLYKSIKLEQTVPEQTVYGKAQKPNKPRKQIIKKPFISEENKDKIKTIIRDIWNLFDSEEEKGERKKETREIREKKTT